MRFSIKIILLSLNSTHLTSIESHLTLFSLFSWYGCIMTASKYNNDNLGCTRNKRRCDKEHASNSSSINKHKHDVIAL
jgi:hypothetical protein